MIRKIKYWFTLSSAAIFLLFSCKKETSCENCKGNKPPNAIAGPDQLITLPTDSVLLDGKNSSDPDGTISKWHWEKISGPASFFINLSSASNSVVKNLIKGIYQFELKVTDDDGLSAKDTIEVAVVDHQPPPSLPNCEPNNRPRINAQLVYFGSLSLARSNITAASAGNKILFAGGITSAMEISNRVDIYDLVTQNWSTAELSLPRHSMVTAVLDNKIFFAGGEIPGSNATSRVDIYDASSNTWSTKEMNDSWQMVSAAAIGTKVFFIGNLGNWNIPVNSIVKIYDLSDNSWTTKVLSQPRSGITATAAGNKVYFAGGFYLNGVNIDPSNRIDIYDNSTGQWTISTLSEPKLLMYSFYKNEKIYWGGGLSAWDHIINEGILSCKVEIRDVNNQNSVFANLSSIREGASHMVVEKNNKILFFYGDNYFDIYDIINKTWAIGELPVNVYWASIISVNNTIYVDGGIASVFSSGQVWKLEF